MRLKKKIKDHTWDWILIGLGLALFGLGIHNEYAFSGGIFLMGFGAGGL